MMYQDSTLKTSYIKEVQAQVLELPYEGEELSMIVLLPDNGVDLSVVRWEALSCFLFSISAGKIQGALHVIL